MAAKKAPKRKPSLRDKMSAAYSKMESESRRAIDKEGTNKCNCGRKGCKDCGC